MTRHSNLLRILVFASFAVQAVKAHSHENTSLPLLEPPATTVSWIDQIWSLPVFRLFAPAIDRLPELHPVTSIEPPGCLVQPLPPISDTNSLEFEANAGSPLVVNLEGLTRPTAHALTRFERIVKAAGGLVSITSAYRPSAYQEHLQAVWDKRMIELRYNNDLACQELKAEVEEEFERHQLLESQRPAPFSDHTRGISFDASVRLPARARLNRRRVNVDILARRAGFHRPAIARDPVHFRLIAKL